MKHKPQKPQVISGEELANRIIASEQIDDHDFSMAVSDAGDILDGVASKYFVVQWPEHCVTTQHLGDAAISEAFDTKGEAIASVIDPNPAHDVTGNGAESHYDLARQLEMRGYDVDADTEDNEHSYVRFNGELVGDIYGDSEATVTSLGDV
jgi:hypothetical protein